MTIFRTASTSAGAADGSSWANRCTKAYADANATSGDSVYFDDVTFIGKLANIDGVTYYGGFDGSAEIAPSARDLVSNVTTIDGSGANPIIDDLAGNTVVCDGLHFTSQNAAAYSSHYLGSAGDLTFRKCTLTGGVTRNNCMEVGSASPYLTFEDCLLAGMSNTFEIIWTDGSATVTVNNCTIEGRAATQPTAFSATASSTHTITNSIVYGNFTGTVLAGSVTATYSCIQGGFTGTGNISSDPTFVGSGDYSLQSGSPCIGAANSGTATASDRILYARDGSPDMGAYEYQSAANIAGSSAGVGAATGSISGRGAVAGSAAGAGTATASVAGRGAVSGASSGTGSATGAVGGRGDIAGASAGVGAATGSVTNATTLSGTAAGTSTATGTVTGRGAVAGSAAGVAAATGAVSGRGAVAGTSAGAASATASVGGRGAIAGTSGGIATATGAVAGKGAVAGSSAGASSATGALSGRGAVAGSAAGAGTATAAVFDASTLSGSAAGTSTATGTVTGRGAIAGSAAGVGSAVATLAGKGAISGASAGVASITGAVFGRGAVAGTAAGAGSATGAIANSSLIAGQASGVGTATGIIFGRGAIAGTAAGVGAATGTLSQWIIPAEWVAIDPRDQPVFINPI